MMRVDTCQACAPDPGDASPIWGDGTGADERDAGLPPTADGAGAMTAHHDRLRAILLVHGLEADYRSQHSGEDMNTVSFLTARVARVYARLDGVRLAAIGSGLRDQRDPVDTGADSEAWMLAVYDAALVELCAALSLGQSLVDDTVCSGCERQRVELELLSSVLPLG
jgi:hypothetical protein